MLPLRVDRQRHLRKDHGARAALRTLMAARDHMTSERTADVNALTALLRVLYLGIDARRPLTGKQISEVARWRTRAEDIAAVIARAEAVRLARACLPKVSGSARDDLFHGASRSDFG